MLATTSAPSITQRLQMFHGRLLASAIRPFPTILQLGSAVLCFSNPIHTVYNKLSPSFPVPE